MVQKLERMIQREAISFIDLKYAGLLGNLHHITIPAHRFRSIVSDGVGIDGSSIPGYKGVKRCDMIVVPDLDYFFIEPFFDKKTISFLCRSLYSYDRSPFEKDPRSLAGRLEAYLKHKGYSAFFLPELEFYLFNSAQFGEEAGHSFFRVTSEEGLPDGDHPHHGFAIRKKGGYHAAPPFDRTANLRNELCRMLMNCGIEVKYHHHEVGRATQVEIELVFNGLQRTCDYVTLSKYIIRNQARAAGLAATFMPKPLFGEPGNGMHVHHYLLRDGRPFLFDRKNVSRLAKPGECYVAGMLEHAPALCALTNPSTNSYKRLIPGYEAPTYTDYAVGSRAAAIRIPEYVRDPKTQRIEYRICDAMANPYLALPAIVMAGLDGIRRKLTKVSKKRLPGNLLEALNELRKDHEFLLHGGILTEELLMQWIEVKTAEFEAVASRPTSQEYILYFGS